MSGLKLVEIEKVYKEIEDVLVMGEGDADLAPCSKEPCSIRASKRLCLENVTR